MAVKISKLKASPYFHVYESQPVNMKKVNSVLLFVTENYAVSFKSRTHGRRTKALQMFCFFLKTKFEFTFQQISDITGIDRSDTSKMAKIFSSQLNKKKPEPAYTEWIKCYRKLTRKF